MGVDIIDCQKCKFMKSSINTQVYFNDQDYGKDQNIFYKTKHLNIDYNDRNTENSSKPTNYNFYTLNDNKSTANKTKNDENSINIDNTKDIKKEERLSTEPNNNNIIIGKNNTENFLKNFNDNFINNKVDFKHIGNQKNNKYSLSNNHINSFNSTNNEEENIKIPSINSIQEPKVNKYINTSPNFQSINNNPYYTKEIRKPTYLQQPNQKIFNSNNTIEELSEEKEGMLSSQNYKTKNIKESNISKNSKILDSVSSQQKNLNKNNNINIFLSNGKSDCTSDSGNYDLYQSKNKFLSMINESKKINNKNEFMNEDNSKNGLINKKGDNNIVNKNEENLSKKSFNNEINENLINNQNILELNKKQKVFSYTISEKINSDIPLIKIFKNDIKNNVNFDCFGDYEVLL